MPWVTPDTDNPLVVMQMTLPADFVPIIEGAILELTYLYNWQEYGNLTPEECVRIFIDAMQTITYTDA